MKLHLLRSFDPLRRNADMRLLAIVFCLQQSKAWNQVQIWHDWATTTNSAFKFSSQQITAALTSIRNFIEIVLDATWTPSNIFKFHSLVTWTGIKRKIQLWNEVLRSWVKKKLKSDLLFNLVEVKAEQSYSTR